MAIFLRMHKIRCVSTLVIPGPDIQIPKVGKITVFGHYYIFDALWPRNQYIFRGKHWLNQLQKWILYNFISMHFCRICKTEGAVTFQS